MTLNWPAGWTHRPELEMSAKKTWSFSEIPGGLDFSRVERFEVRPGDCGDQDATRDKERAEMSQVGPKYKTEVTSPIESLQYDGDEYWYRWELAVPPNWLDSGNAPNTSKQVHLGQFLQTPDPHRDDDWEPAFMFGKRAEGGPFRLWTFPLARTKGKIPEHAWRQAIQLIPHNEFVGRSHELVVHARWSLDASGWFRVWVNGVRKYGYDGPTISPGNCNVRHKYGIYRAATPANPVDCVVYFSGLRRGTSSEAVTQTALEAGDRQKVRC